MTRIALITTFVILGLKANAQYYPYPFVANYDPYAFGKFPFNFESFENCAEVSVEDDTIKPLFFGGKFYYKNILSKKLLFGNSFDEAYPFCKGYAVVKINGKYGIINRKGEIVVAPNYERFLKPNEFSYIYLEDSQGDKEFDYNTGELGPGRFRENSYDLTEKNTVIHIRNKYGIIFKEGSKINATYDSILSNRYTNYAVVKNNGRIGVIDKNGKILLPLIYKQFADGYPDRYALKIGKTWKYFNYSKLLFISNKEPFYWKYDMVIYKSNGFYGRINAKGSQILPAKYKWISLISPIAINKNNQLVFYSKNGREFVYYTIKNAGLQK